MYNAVTGFRARCAESGKAYVHPTFSRSLSRRGTAGDLTRAQNDGGPRDVERGGFSLHPVRQIATDHGTTLLMTLQHALYPFPHHTPRIHCASRPLCRRGTVASRAPRIQSHLLVRICREQCPANKLCCDHEPHATRCGQRFHGERGCGDWCDEGSRRRCAV
jgi:hypothetical protein